jgi:maleylpyruvate isomerase
MNGLVLHGYWRSTASYRVRVALALKGLDYQQAPHDLRTGAHRDPEFKILAPHSLVPVLETQDGVISQSLAILEWLEETYPIPALLPRSPGDRAIVRGVAAAIACDIHPLNNLRVLDALRGEFSASSVQVSAWIGRWIREGFTGLETLISRHGGAFTFGEAPGFADCCLVPQVYSARRFGVELQDFPRILAVDERVRAIPAVAEAHPERQPDAD